MFVLENVTCSDKKFRIEDDLMFGSNFSSTNVSEFALESLRKNETQLNVIYAVMEMLVAFFAVIGNATVILVFLRERKLRRRTNYYIFSLALADFLVGLLGIPFAILVNDE